MLKTCVAFVTYNTYGTYDWTSICVRSFRKVFDHDVPLFVVDHNHNPEEREFLTKNNISIIENDDIKTHGKGLDVATEFAKAEGYDAIVFVEPDCVFYNRVWYDDILNLLESGKSMAATFRWDYGPLHPCGSGWLIRDIPGSFQDTRKSEDEVFHPRFVKLMDLDNLCTEMHKRNYPTSFYHFFLYRWDVGIRNWFLLEKDFQAVKANPEGFHHFWGSHARTPRDVCRVAGWTKPLVEPWLPKVKIY